jgi:hypothetical protein
MGLANNSLRIRKKSTKNLRRTAAIGVLMSASLTAYAQDWLEYINTTDRFIVNFPGTPEVTEITHRSAFGADFPGRVYTVDNARGRYVISVIDYRDSEAIHNARTDRTEANSSASVSIVDVRASIAHVANQYRTRGGVVTYDAWADIDKVEGHQLQITNPDESRTFVAIHLHKSLLYVLEATVPAGAPPPGLFQQSLGFLDEQARRVRYFIDPEGNRTRQEILRHDWIEVDPSLTGEQIIE